MKLFVSLFAACVIVFPIYLICTGIANSKKRQEKAVEKAIKEGHVVQAVLVKRSTNVERVPGVESKFVALGVYKFTYKGKKYIYRCWTNSPPQTLKLYFIKNPRKARRKNELVDSKVSWPVIFTIVTLLAYWVASTGNV